MIENYVAFDFETASGKNPCSIGIIEFQNGKIVNEPVVPYDLKEKSCPYY